jgi:hypothetical protein
MTIYEFIKADSEGGDFTDEERKTILKALKKAEYHWFKTTNYYGYTPVNDFYEKVL